MASNWCGSYYTEHLFPVKNRFLNTLTYSIFNHITWHITIYNKYGLVLPVILASFHNMYVSWNSFVIFMLWACLECAHITQCTRSSVCFQLYTVSGSCFGVSVKMARLLSFTCLLIWHGWAGPPTQVMAVLLTHSPLFFVKIRLIQLQGMSQTFSVACQGLTGDLIRQSLLLIWLKSRSRPPRAS